jgi:CheY-like chemotaxis protein
MTAADSQRPADHPAPPRYVLVVDDEPDMRDSVTRILHRGGYESVAAGSGEEALIFFQQRRPLLILTDLRMPGMDGLALLRAVREHGSPIPVVVVTAYASDATAREALAAGASAFLPKPFTGAQLLGAVRAALDHGLPATGSA